MHFYKNNFIRKRGFVSLEVYEQFKNYSRYGSLSMKIMNTS